MKSVVVKQSDNFRVRRMTTGKFVVELNTQRNGWVWCLYRSTTKERAESLFNSQVALYETKSA